MVAKSKELEVPVQSEFDKWFVSLGGNALQKLQEAYNEKKTEWGKAESEHEQRLAELRAAQTDAEKKTIAAQEKFVSLGEEIRSKRDELADIQAKIAEAKPIADAYQAVVKRHHEELARIGS